ncbi:hypothetical protein L1887_05386 [Cichorium endivia]|nr:hypothetical protein L1887_05386 [Cichorium endivia]
MSLSIQKHTSTPNMYRHCYSSSPPDFFTSSELLPPPTPPHEALDYFMAPPLLPIRPFEMDSLYAPSCDGGGYDSPVYAGSQRVVMQKNGSVDCIVTHINSTGLLYPLVSSPTELFDSDGSSSSVTKVCSTSDLQGASMMQCNRSESSFSNENIIEGMNKICRYSPKQKKERIDRYKSKKNQRNFNKKIKYVCRKTLADRRTRIKGRFARNNEVERTSDQGGGEGRFDEEGVNNWIFNFSDPFSSNLIS